MSRQYIQSRGLGEGFSEGSIPDQPFNRLEQFPLVQGGKENSVFSIPQDIQHGGQFRRNNGLYQGHVLEKNDRGAEIVGVRKHRDIHSVQMVENFASGDVARENDFSGK